VIDRIIGIAGLALALLIYIAPMRWPTIPKPLVDCGLVLAGILIGIAVAPIVYLPGARPAPQHTLIGPTKFHLNMTGANIFLTDPTIDAPKQYTGISLNAKIWNTGKPSFATDWMLTVSPPGERPVIAQFTNIPEVLRVGGAINSAVIRQSDSLERATSESPVQSTPISGALLFYTNLPKPKVVDPRTILSLSVKDENENETVLSKSIGDWMQR
jgi:hypothetical protein